MTPSTSLAEPKERMSSDIAEEADGPDVENNVSYRVILTISPFTVRATSIGVAKGVADSPEI